MKTKLHLVLPAVVALGLSGCVGTGPNTQRGALSGGALGALAGAVIGNNSGHGNGLNGALIGGAVGAIAGGTVGNQADHERGTIYGEAPERAPTRVSSTTEIIVDAPPPLPPPPREVIYERTAPDAVWIRGYYVYGRRGYVWVPGHWEVPPPQRREYIAAHWQRRGNGYVYVDGHWR